MSKILFMHTIDGKAAEFSQDQITYAMFRRPVRLVASRKQILKDREAEKSARIYNECLQQLARALARLERKGKG